VLDGSDLIELIRRQAPARPVGVALLTLEALRLALERQELDVITAARSSGMSWQQIGVAVGRSRDQIRGRYALLQRRWGSS
jgi:hypothetical protein